MKTNGRLTTEQIDTDIKTRMCIFGAFKSGDDISIPLIQRRCATGYFTASRTLENLIEDGFVKRGETAHSVCKFL